MTDLGTAGTPQPAPTTQGIQEAPQLAGDDLQARAKAAFAAGLISPEQYAQMQARMGFSQNKPAAPNYAGAGQGPAGIGTAAGQIVGKIGTKMYNAATAPPQPGQPLDISAQGPGASPPPSPAWDNTQ